jgi:hypothetical protein
MPLTQNSCRALLPFAILLPLRAIRCYALVSFFTTISGNRRWPGRPPIQIGAEIRCLKPQLS